MMTFASILFGLTLVVVSLPFVVGPQVGKGVQFRFPGQKKKRNADKINPFLSAISDLDIDHLAGLINQEDYLSTRLHLLDQAAQYYSAENNTDEDAIEGIIEKRKQTLKELMVCPNCDSTIKDIDNFCQFCGTKLI